METKVSLCKIVQKKVELKLSLLKLNVQVPSSFLKTLFVLKDLYKNQYFT